MVGQIDAVFKADLLASDYEEVMGNGLNLNDWIAFSLSKITSISESELLGELERTDRLGMLGICSAEALEILSDSIFGYMKSDRDRLREIQSCPVKSLAFYGPSKVLAVGIVSETFEYVEVPAEPAIEFVDVDPETQAEILSAMNLAA
ncbi:MAG: hypothetical protein ACEQSB_06415 [Undibacterium sp.]